MSEKNETPNPNTGEITHIIHKRIDAKRTRFAGVARDGVVFVNHKPVPVHEFVGDDKTLVIETLEKKTKDGRTAPAESGTDSEAA